MDDLNSYTVKELKELAKKEGLTNYSKLKKDDLIGAINNRRQLSISPKRKSIPKIVRDKIWNDNIGLAFGIGKCYCCQNQITKDYYQCGHIVSRAMGGDDSPDNLKPICSLCNQSMGTQNMDEFMKEYKLGKYSNIENSPEKVENAIAPLTNNIAGLNLNQKELHPIVENYITFLLYKSDVKGNDLGVWRYLKSQCAFYILETVQKEHPNIHCDVNNRFYNYFLYIFQLDKKEIENKIDEINDRMTFSNRTDFPRELFLRCFSLVCDENFKCNAKDSIKLRRIWLHKLFFVNFKNINAIKQNQFNELLAQTRFNGKFYKGVKYEDLAYFYIAIDDINLIEKFEILLNFC